LLTDPVDAFWTAVPLGFEGKPFRSLSQGDVDFDLIPRVDQGADAEPKPDESDETNVIAAVKEALGERVADVRASKRLTDSAACLVAEARGPDRELERLLARQNRGVGAKPVLELNMRHPVVTLLAQAKVAGRNDEVADLAALLFEQAQILDGEVPSDPAQFAARVNRLMMGGRA
jgi:molecular chaperone HtpG